MQLSYCGAAETTLRQALGTTSGGEPWWCRGPESNWLRPPFQGGALPMSYPGIDHKTNGLRKTSRMRETTYVSFCVSFDGGFFR